MAVQFESFLRYDSDSDDNQFDISVNNPKQALLDSTNIHLRNSLQTHRNRRQRSSSTLGTLRRCKKTTKGQKYSDGKRTDIDTDLITNIESFQDEQLQIQQRAMYNARQTPLIPLLTDIDFSSLIAESSEIQNDLLTDILTLLSYSNEECSFFEQFKI